MIRWDDAVLYAQERKENNADATLLSWLSDKTGDAFCSFLTLLADAAEGVGGAESAPLDLPAGAKTAICDWRRLAVGGGNKLLGVNYFAYPEASERLRELRSKKIYFDFETVNQAVRVIDGSLPFMQIVTQCSVVVDEGDGKLGDCENLIVDPANITDSFFKEIVDSLYRENAHEYSYVVYNQSFEINRLIEMKSILDNDEYSKKIDAIIANVYDLADFFAPNKRLLTIAQLYSYYSIKYVLGLVPQRLLSETGTVSYSSLAVKRGDRAQALSALRFLGALTDAEWSDAAEDLKRYCENDVRAMVAVERFARELIKNYKHQMLDFSGNDDPKLLKAAAIALFEPDDEARRRMISALLDAVKKMPEIQRHQLTAAWRAAARNAKEAKSGNIA